MNRAVIKFGTDGWRGIIAEDFTFNNVRLCAQATADYIVDKYPSAGVVIGYDTRFGSQDFAWAVAEVMATNGIEVTVSQSYCPTPVVSHATAATGAAAGVVITASHNAGNWNGFKIKEANGASATDQFVKGVEDNIQRIQQQSRHHTQCVPPCSDAVREMIITADLSSHYITRLEELVDTRRLTKSHLSVAYDAMFGAGSGFISRLIGGGNLSVNEIHCAPNPAFPGIKQPEPIGANLEQLAAFVRETGAGVGLATDGDADRLGVIDENGCFLNSLQVYSLLVLYLLEVRRERGAIVKTITSSNMLDRLGELYGVPVYEVPVGFKYVAPVMINQDAMIGGEESGGYGYRHHIPERDGILSALYFLDYITSTGARPSQLLKMLYAKVGPHYYDRHDYQFPPGRRDVIMQRVSQAEPSRLNGKRVVSNDHVDGYRFKLEDDSWLLIRFSGTEPLLRIYSESNSPQEVELLLAEGRMIAGI